MRAGAVWVASFAALLLVGAPAVWRMRNLPLFGRAGVGAGVGAVLVSTVMTLSALIDAPWNAAILLIVSLAASIALGRILAADPQPDGQVEGSWLRLAASLLSAAAVGVVALSILAGASTSGDMIMFWGPKAQAFALAQTIDPAFFRDPFLGYMHPSYPPLVTNLYAFAAMAAGRMAWGAATATFPLLLAGLALALPGLLRESAGEPAASAASGLAVAGIGFVGMEADIAGNGEMPLLFFETLAMALLVRRDAGKPAMQLLAGILLAGAASAKIEGLPFVLAAAALFPLLRRDLPGRLPAALRLSLPTVAAVGVWFAYGARHGLFYGYRGYGSFLTIHPEMLPGVAAAVGHFLWRIGYAAPYLAPLIFLALRRRPWRPAWLPLGVAAALCAFLFFTYLHEDPNTYLWIGWSASRVFSPVIPLVAIAAATGTACRGQP